MGLTKFRIFAASSAVTLALAVPVSAQSLQQAAPAQAEAAQAPGPVKRLSVADAVQLALEQNLNLQVQRLDPQVQDLAISQVRSAWTPLFTTTLVTSNSKSPVNSFLSGATDKLTNDSFQAIVSAQQQLPWGGGSFNIDWNNSRTENNSAFSSPNPSLRGEISLTYTQPLLRNFRIDSVRQQLLVSRKNREISDVQLQQAVLTTTRNVKSAYWDLAYAINSLSVQRQSLELAQESLRNNRSRVEIGTMAPIDIVEAEAEVAQREEAVLLAEAAVTRAEDALRALVFDPTTPDFWSMRLELTDEPTFQDQAIDLTAAVSNAMANRTDLLQARKNIEASDISIRYFRNQILPDVNLQAGYGVTGQGGTQYNFGDGFPPVVMGRIDEGYGKVLSRMFGRDFPNWSVALQVGYPLGRSNAEAGLARARIQYQQSQIQLRNLELQVATQVREVARQVNTNRKRVDSTRAARQLAERRLEAEQKKFAAGMSSSFFVIQAQRDLAQARNAELQAILDYNRSLVDFETVQQAPVGGTGAMVSVVSAGGGGSGSSISSGSQQNSGRGPGGF
ncbi:MAG TPA: TolC family protein [Vicinamibacterales bacterium]|nr:TolC family protein [Vicinamibacterales bacterium]